MDTSARPGLRLIHIQDFEEPYTMPPAEREAYHRRFCTLFLDESRLRRGGLGKVGHVVNAQGEAFALKMLILPSADAYAQDEAALHEAARRAAFDEEYQSHRALSGIKGFPRLYGRGTVDGAPVLVMEWVEGETLAAARRRLYAPGMDMVLPLTAARLGRDVFDLLRRMRLVGEGFVHRDISPANIMIRTDLRSVERQADEGSFDVVLIDFGSSAEELLDAAATRFTAAYDLPRRATPAYAAPEMMVEEASERDSLRRSCAVDVYEAASVLYELLCGCLPFPARPQDGLDPRPRPLYQRKMTDRVAYPASAHAVCDDMCALLASEPQVALALGETALQLGVEPASDRVRMAFHQVDDLIAQVVLACLEPSPQKRPAPEEAYDALSGICSTYAQNVCRALRGERLLPVLGGALGGAGASSFGAARVLCGAGSAIAGVTGFFIAARTALQMGAGQAVIGWGAWTLQGDLVAPLGFFLLVLPGLAGFLACGGAGVSQRGFARGSAVLAAVFALEAAAAASGLAGAAVWDAARFATALFAVSACGWCPMVLRFATLAPERPATARPRRDALAWVRGDAPTAYEEIDVTRADETLDAAGIAKTEAIDASAAMLGTMTYDRDGR